MVTVALCLFPPFSFGKVRHKEFLKVMAGKFIPENESAAAVLTNA